MEQLFFTLYPFLITLYLGRCFVRFNLAFINKKPIRFLIIYLKI